MPLLNKTYETRRSFAWPEKWRTRLASLKSKNNWEMESKYLKSKVVHYFIFDRKAGNINYFVDHFKHIDWNSKEQSSWYISTQEHLITVKFARKAAWFDHFRRWRYSNACSSTKKTVCRVGKNQRSRFREKQTWSLITLALSFTFFHIDNRTSNKLIWYKNLRSIKIWTRTTSFWKAS